MGELTKAFRELEEYRHKFNSDILAKEKAIQEQHSAISDNLVSIKEARESRMEAYANFSKEVKDVLLMEAIYAVYSPCCVVEENNKELAQKLVRNFVKENGGTSNILFKVEGKSYLIETLTNLIDKYHSIIIEKVDKEDPSTLKADPEDVDNFLDELENEDDIENVKQAIAVRVANAEEEFLTNNIADKQDMKDIIDDTSDRIAAAKADDGLEKDTKDAIAQEATRMSKVKIEDVRSRRPRTVYEQMVRTLSESVIKEDALKEAYSNDDNMLDIAKIVESSKCMYGLLETVNTMKLENVTEEYIKNMLNI